VASVALIALSIPIMVEPEEIDYLDEDLCTLISLVLYAFSKSIITIFLLILWSFHVYLSAKQITTYQFILNRRNNKIQTNECKVANKDTTPNPPADPSRKTNDHRRNFSKAPFRTEIADMSKYPNPTMEKIKR
jgi:hypothetical protein